ncbi:MAG: hypothetical protein Q8P90_03265 [bacterium]|nr:hypothetical protein [bacterium]
MAQVEVSDLRHHLVYGPRYKKVQYTVRHALDGTHMTFRVKVDQFPFGQAQVVLWWVGKNANTDGIFVQAREIPALTLSTNDPTRTITPTGAVDRTGKVVDSNVVVETHRYASGFLTDFIINLPHMDGQQHPGVPRVLPRLDKVNVQKVNVQDGTLTVIDQLTGSAKVYDHIVFTCERSDEATHLRFRVEGMDAIPVGSEELVLEWRSTSLGGYYIQVIVDR